MLPLLAAVTAIMDMLLSLLLMLLLLQPHLRPFFSPIFLHGWKCAAFLALRTKISRKSPSTWFSLQCVLLLAITLFAKMIYATHLRKIPVWYFYAFQVHLQSFRWSFFLDGSASKQSQIRSTAAKGKSGSTLLDNIIRLMFDLPQIQKGFFLPRACPSRAG